MAFHVRQKVVCVDPTNDLVADRVYTIVAVAETPVGQMVDVDGSAFRPWAFFARRFRPLVERKTDISIFTAMLNPSLADLASHILNEVT